MRSLPTYAIVLLAFFELSASRLAMGSVAYSIDLFNSSEFPVELVNARTGRPVATISPGRSLAFAYAQGVNIRTFDGRRLHYDRVDPPKEFMRVGLLAATFRVQMSSDLRIWVVPPAAQRPVLPPPQQPAGFPLLAR